MKTANAIVVAVVLAACGEGSSFRPFWPARPAKKPRRPHPSPPSGRPVSCTVNASATWPSARTANPSSPSARTRSCGTQLPGKGSREWKGSWMRGTLSADGRTVALSANAPNIDVFDLGSGKQLARLSLPNARSDAVAISADGRLVAGGHTEAIVWDLGSGRKTQAVADYGERCRALVSFRWTALVVADVLGDMWIHDIDNDGHPVELEGETGARPWFASSPDGKTLAGSCEIGRSRSSLRFWDAATGRMTHEVPGSFPHGAFSPDGKLLAASGLDKVRVIELPRGGRSGDYRWGMRPAARWPCANGKTLATAQGNRVHLWDTASWTEIHPSVITPARCNRVAFSPDGRTIATGGLDGSLVLWSWPEAEPGAAAPRVCDPNGESSD